MYFLYGFDIDEQLAIDSEELLRRKKLFQLIEVIIQQIAVAAEVDGVAELTIRIVIGGSSRLEIMELLPSFDQQPFFVTGGAYLQQQLFDPVR